MTDPRKPAFEGVIEAFRAAGKDNPFNDPGNIHAFHNLLDAWGLGREGEDSRTVLRTSQRGIDLIHSFETCAKLRPDGRYETYPDPGSANGLPWTIGWGSTGAGITRGTVWTKGQCDARFAADLLKFENGVREAIGDTPTTQSQFDALVSFHYNTGEIKTATLTRRHKERDYAGAAKQFGRWVFNDKKKMRGLVRRRAAEADLYRSGR